MTLSRDAFAALGFLAFSLAYGWQATGIDMFPGQEFEPFTPRTFPYALAVAGVVLSLIQLVSSLRRQGDASQPSWRGFDWVRVLWLVAAMVAYGTLFTPLGFLVATTLFLAAGYLILGERRWIVVAGASAVVAIGFCAIMPRLLGLYLAPVVLLPPWLQLRVGG